MNLPLYFKSPYSLLRALFHADGAYVVATAAQGVTVSLSLLWVNRSTVLLWQAEEAVRE